MPLPYDWKTWSDILENAAKVIALMVGGFWTYQLYVKQRTRYPRVQIAHSIKVVPLSGKFALLTVAVSVKNIGTVLVSIDEAFARLYDVTTDGVNPAADADEKASKSIRSNDGLRFKFPPIKELKKEWGKGQFELEPQEQDQVVFDFVIPVSVKAVRIYTYFNNEFKRGKKIGWSDSSVHLVEKLKEGVAY
jgi:hypothetical protein